MIYSEPVIFDFVSRRLREIYGDKFPVYNEYVEQSARFPLVSAIQVDAPVYQRMRTTHIENAQEVTWEVNVFSNLAPTAYTSAKIQANEIMMEVDEAFSEMGFTRVMLSPVENLQDASIYRLVARYTAVIDEDLWIYTE